MTRLWFAFFVVVYNMPLKAQVTFTEVMFDLEGADYHDEFIEVYNLSTTDSVNFTGWYLSDSTNIDRLTEAGEGISLAPLSFAVILDGSYFFSLVQRLKLLKQIPHSLSAGRQEVVCMVDE